MITLTGPAVAWSSDEDDEEEDAVEDEPDETDASTNQNPVSDLTDIKEEETESEDENIPEVQTEVLEPAPVPEPAPPAVQPENVMRFSPPAAPVPQQNQPEMSFEDALSMLSRKKPKKVAQREYAKPMVSLVDGQEEKITESDPETESETIEKIIQNQKPVTITEPEKSDEEEFDRTVEIDIGDIRELDEDERIIVIPPPKEESTVEARVENFDEQFDFFCLKYRFFSPKF